jgi:poly(A) polymerase/tRNA nucleotidyltransferase (CCA-adding enzyme)
MKQRIDLSMLELLDKPVRNHVIELYRNLTAHGFHCHLVGGCVRDLLLGRRVQDVDITTDARPEDVMRIFRRTVPTGLKHGTVTVLLDGHPYEVTTYRTESDYSDGRRPDRIEFARTLEEDLSRRDFTINALALNPETGELIDEFDGLSDLKRKIIRTIGSPEDRFYEDALRPVRACRFRATLGFHIERATHDAMLREDIRSRMKGVAIERFSDELWKGFRASQPSPMLEALQEADLLSIFVPCVRPQSVSFLESLNTYEDSVFRMALWLDRASDEPVKCAEHLRFSKAVIRRIILYGALFRMMESFDMDSARNGTLDRSRWRVFLGRLKKELRGEGEGMPASFLEAASGFITETALPLFKGDPDTIRSDRSSRSAQRQGSTAASELLSMHYRWMQHSLASEPLLITDLAVNGNDLQKSGFHSTGLGFMLKHLLNCVHEDPSLNTREWLLQEVERQRKS